jgi:hypothetical protein
LAWESLKVFLQEVIPEKEPDPGRGHCRSDLWRPSRLHSPLPYPDSGRMLLRQRQVPGGPFAGAEKTGAVPPR